MKKLTSTTAILLFCASMASAALNTDAVIADFQTRGFTRIEVKNGLTQTKIEAIRGTEKVEVIYNKATGEVLKRETETVRAGEDTGAGVTIRNRNRDFLKVRDGSDDDSDDDQNEDDQNDDDDVGDDDEGDGDEGDGDEGDDDDGDDDEGDGDEGDGDEGDGDEGDDDDGDDDDGDEGDGDDGHGGSGHDGDDD